MLSSSRHMAPPSISLEPLRLALILVAAVVGGVVNSIAGGGTLLTFPALIGLGIPAVVANATSTVALWPGAVASMWGYRDLLVGMRSWVTRFAIPSLLGGLLGAVLLIHTPPARFDAIVPWLVLGATVLFMVQNPLADRLVRRGETPARSAIADDHDADRAVRPDAKVLAYQFGV